MNDLLIKTPNYVLLHGKQKIGLKTLALESGQVCIAIYGFSDKQPYDKFCENSELALTPYPLVKGYLRNQLEGAGDTILIIAIDCTGPNDQVLNASTMQTVLDAHETATPQISASHRLTQEDQTDSYRVDEYGPAAPV